MLPGIIQSITVANQGYFCASCYFRSGRVGKLQIIIEFRLINKNIMEINKSSLLMEINKSSLLSH